MGKDLFDYYSGSHFVGGILVQRMGLSRLVAYGLHIIFEICENYIYFSYFKERCVHFLYILPVVDCKTAPDTLQNMIGDQMCFMMGYEFARFIHIRYLPMFPKYFILGLPILPFVLSLITTNLIELTKT